MSKLINKLSKKIKNFFNFNSNLLTIVNAHLRIFARKINYCFINIFETHDYY